MGARSAVEAGVRDVIVKTLIAAEGEVTPALRGAARRPGGCYEVFGFDILVDRRLRCHLVEVNISPSLMCAGAVDRRVKGALVADAFHLVGFSPPLGLDPGPPLPTLAERLRAQAPWRREQAPGRVDLAGLLPGDWDQIRAFEDEVARRGHFELLYPRPESVMRYLPLFRTPRLADHVLARWVAGDRHAHLPRMLRGAHPADGRVRRLLEEAAEHRRRGGAAVPGRDTRVPPPGAPGPRGPPGPPGPGRRRSGAAVPGPSTQVPPPRAPESSRSRGPRPGPGGRRRAQPQPAAGPPPRAAGGGRSAASALQRAYGPAADGAKAAEGLQAPGGSLARDLRRLGPEELRALVGQLEMLQRWERSA